MAWRKGPRGGGPARPGPPGYACIANSPPACKGAAFLGLQQRRRPSLQIANSAKASSGMQRERCSGEMGCKTISDREALGRWEGLAKQGLDFPPSLDSQLADPSPSRPRLCSCKGGKEKRIRTQTWGARPPSRSYCSGTARGRATRAPPPRNSASRVGTGPRPLPKLGFCVCKGGGPGIRDTPP